MTTDVSILMNPTLTTNPGATSTFPKIPSRVTNAPSESEATVVPEVTERLTKLGKDLAAIHRVCSEAYCTQGLYADALRHQKVSVDMDPAMLEYRNQRGFLHYMVGNDVEASQDFTFVVQNDASNHEAWFNLGMVHFGCGQYIEAERCFDSCVQLLDTDPEAWNNLGVARFHLGRIKDAKACFESALAIEPDYVDAQANMDDLCS